MPCSVAKLIKLINMTFMIPNCDDMFCSKIDQVDKHGLYDTKL